MNKSLYFWGFASAVCAVVLLGSPAQAVNVFDGKIIALDAGHGGGETGAVGYCNGTPAVEADVNQAVRAALKAKLEVAGAAVFEVPQLSSRKGRVQAAEDAHADVLISIHHNGSSNTGADYTQSFVTQKNDKVLASYIHPRLVAALGLTNKGIKSDGYGMTVYGSLPGILTEAYFITNTAEACDFVGPKVRIEQEAQAVFNGLSQYFAP